MEEEIVPVVVVRRCQCGCDQILTGRQLKYATENCKKIGSRNAHLKKLYDLTLDDYNKILTYQDGVCGICKRAPRDGEVFHVDHEHRDKQAGPVRGLLCPYCNTRLVGRLKSHERAQAMADYLRDPPCPKALQREVWATGRPKRRRTTRRKRGTK